MSFYLGKKSNGNKIMIATKESGQSINEMQVLSPIDCEFHSDMPFISLTPYTATVTDYGYITYSAGWLFDWNSAPTWSICLAELPIDFYAASNNKICIVVADGMIIDYFSMQYGLRNRLSNTVVKSMGSLWVNELPSASRNNYRAWEGEANPNSVYKYLVIPKKATTSNHNLDATYSIPNVKVYITNINLYGTVTPLPYDFTQGILINNNQLKINGYDLFKLKYLSNISLSNSDISISANGGNLFTIGDTDSSDIGMSIVTNNTNGSIIKKGNTVLFDTSKGKRGSILYRNYSNNYYTAAIYSYRATYNVLLASIPNFNLDGSNNINVYIHTKITSTTVKHNNSTNNIQLLSKATAPGFVWGPGVPLHMFYDYPRESGGKFFSLQQYDTNYFVDLDEYWFHDTSFTATKGFKLVTVYITKKINGSKTDVVLVVNTNPEYTNGSADIDIAIEAQIMV